MAYKTKMGICTSETQEDVKVLSWWVKEEDDDEDEPPFLVIRAIGRIFLADCCKDLKGGERKL